MVQQYDPKAGRYDLNSAFEPLPPPQVAYAPLYVAPHPHSLKASQSWYTPRDERYAAPGPLLDDGRGHTQRENQSSYFNAPPMPVFTGDNRDGRENGARSHAAMYEQHSERSHTCPVSQGLRLIYDSSSPTTKLCLGV